MSIRLDVIETKRSTSGRKKIKICSAILVIMEDDVRDEEIVASNDASCT